MGSTSPFRRRPALARTYGSSSTSAAAASTAPSAVAAAASASTSERRTSARAGARVAHKKDQGSLAALLAGLSESSDDDDAAARGSERAKMRAAEASSKRQGASAVQTSARRTRSAAAASTTEAETERGAPRGLQGEGSAFWDEARTAADRPKAPKKRASTGGADARAEGDGAGEVRAKRARVSAPAGRSAAVQRKGKGKDTPDEDEDEIPPPFDYVPLAERVQLSSPPKTAPSPAPAPTSPTANTGDIDDLPESRFRPLAGLTRASRAAAAAAASADSSASLAKPANAAASTLAPNKASPAPTRSPAKRTRSTTAASPAAKAPAPSPAPAPAKPVRPPSPAKDLSAIFSRFSAAPAGASVAEGAKQDGRTRLRRSASSSTAATAAAAAATAGSATGGGLRAGMLGRRRGAQEQALNEEEREGEAETRSTSRDYTRYALDRAFSQPNLSSSPLSSPARSPQRPALIASLSQPSLGSPSRLAPFAPSREASPSPARPGPARLPSGGMGPAIGSSYRPMPFPPPAPAFGTGLGAGGTRTYAGVARTLRRDVEEEAFLRPAAGAAPSSSASKSSAPDQRLPSLPPSLSRRTIGSRTSSTTAAAPPPAARETYASLRQRWGIDAEESLVNSEEHDSQDRGARVVGGGVLRKQGEGKRWNDELGWVLEGLRAGADGDRSAARASALDLLEKVQSRDWLRRLKASGEAESIYLALRLASYSPSPPDPDHPAEHLAPDRVLDTAFATLLALLVRDQRLAEPLFRLSPSDVSRERAKRAPSAVDGTGDSQGSAAAALARTQSAGDDSQMTSSSAGWSSSPRKAAGATAAEVDERSDLLELLVELDQREWVKEEVGKAQAKDEAGDEEKATGGRARGKKVLRGDARHLQSLRDLIDAADLFPSTISQSASLRTLVLVITRSIATFVPRTIFQPQHLLCASGLFEQVVQVFLDECSAIDERLRKYETGLDLLPPPSSTVPSISLATLSSCLAIFEATSLATPYAFHLISTPSLLPSLAHALTHLTLVAFLLALDGPGSSQQDRATQHEALGTLTAALGILFGLTTESSWGLALVNRSSASPTHGAELIAVLVRIVVACRTRAKEDAPGTTAAVRRAAMIKEEDEGDPAAPSSSSADTSSRAVGDEASEAASGVGAAAALWDVMSLAMGVLANLAESADEAFKLRVRELHIDSTCHGKRKCAVRCHCADAQADEPATTVIGVLAQLALDPLEDAPNSIYHHSITGFLRLVLGLSILDSPTNEELVLAVLASEPTSLSYSLGPILDALEQLAQLHDEQRAAQSELLASSAGLIGAAPSGADDGAEEDAFESQRTEVDETQRDEGGGGDDEMDGLVVSRAAGEDDDAPRRMREVVQRLRRRIA